MDQQVLCCGAKTWSLVIGWIQTVLGCLSFFIYLVLLIVSSIAVNSPSLDSEDETLLTALIVFCVISLVVCLIAIYGGIILIRGVNEGDPKKIKIWLIFKIIGVVFAVVEIVIGSFSGGTVVVEPVFSLLFGLFFIWVVNLHRQVLLGNTAAAA